MDVSSILDGYDTKKLTVGALGGHSALDVCHGAKKCGFETLVVAQRGREKTYAKYFRTRESGQRPAISGQKTKTKGCVDEVIEVNAFNDILRKDIQEQLRARSTLMVHSRYFWVYVKDFTKVEHEFRVPIVGSRSLLKLEERDQPYNQYHLLRDAGIRTPKVFERSAVSGPASAPRATAGRQRSAIDRPVIVKAAEESRGYERAFFIVDSEESYEEMGTRLEKEHRIGPAWRSATVEEFIVGAPVNFNFFYSPLTGELELMGTDTRRQTNLDGFLRMTSEQQQKALKEIPLKMIETGHVVVTVKESLLEKAFALGEAFVKTTQELPKEVDPSGKGIIGPFALQGAIVAEDGKEDIVIFDVSFRMPGSPGLRATPYSGYLYGEPLSMGERMGMELRRAADEGALEKVLT